MVTPEVSEIVHTKGVEPFLVTDCLYSKQDKVSLVAGVVQTKIKDVLTLVLTNVLCKVHFKLLLSHR